MELSSPLVIDGREVKLTNLEKVFFPARGLTKGDLVGYYLDTRTPHSAAFLVDLTIALRIAP